MYDCATYAEAKEAQDEMCSISGTNFDTIMTTSDTIDSSTNSASFNLSGLHLGGGGVS